MAWRTGAANGYRRSDLISCLFAMVLSRNTRQLIEKQDFDAVESEWLEKIDPAPKDIGYFVSAARALVGAGQTELAKMLLDLLDEQLCDTASWEVRLQLLKRAGTIQHPTAKVHATILETLRSLYRESDIEQLIETVALDRGTNELDKTWDKVGRLQSLVRFGKGVVVYMVGKGVGRVEEVNHALESFKINVEGKGAVRVGFRAAGKMLEALTEEHILARKVNDPESLASLGPTDLLGQTLRDFDRAMTATEVRDALHGVVATAKWNSWWTAARKHPQIVASPTVRHAYRWVESSEDARGAIWRTFENSTPQVKLDLLRRSSSHDAKLRERMGRALERLARDSRSSDPGLAFEIWYAMEKTGVEPEKDDWHPRLQIESMTDPLRLLSGLDGKASRERAYDLFCEVRSDTLDIFNRALMSETDPRLLSRLAGVLKKDAAEDYRRSVERCLAQPGRAGGFFVWLAEQAASDEALAERLAARLFKKVLAAVSNEELSRYRSRMLKLCDSGGTLPRLLPYLSSEQAADAEQALLRAAGLPRDMKERLLNAIHMKFPELREPTESPLYALESSIRNKREELRRILEEEIPTNRRAIEEARAMGDLRENFEYKSARQRHEYLTALATELDQDLSRSLPLDPSTIDASEIRIGTQVELVDDDNVEKRLRILGPWESAPEDDIVSYESDIAKVLLGKREGDEVVINNKTLRISSVSGIDL